jgi:hypothetical protein
MGPTATPSGIRRLAATAGPWQAATSPTAASAARVYGIQVNLSGVFGSCSAAASSYFLFRESYLGECSEWSERDVDEYACFGRISAIVLWR